MAIVVPGLALATLLFGTSVGQAGENKGRVSLSAGMDFTSAYFFRGILQEDTGLIFQPYGDITFNLYEGTDGLNSVGATVGIWNSIHSGPTGADGPNADPKAWYEFDFYSALTFGLFNDWEAGATYTIYTSPNGVFKSTQEIAFALAYDDSELLGAFSLSPHILLAFEFQGGGATGPDTGTYFELGVEPGFTLLESERYPVALAFPLTLGLSLDDYYQNPTTGKDETFGYFDLGLVASMPLGFIPADYGSWEIFVKGDFLFLGDSTKAINSGDSFEAIGTIGISLAY
jgi:hypothetical protein